MTSIPTVSVLLPVHNGMPYLPETVASILGQTFRDFELLALDDGSTDDSTEFLRNQTDARIRYHRLEKLGLVGALNYGLEQARANLIARIDADDIAEPDRLEKQVRFLVNHPSHLVVGCQYVRINERGEVTGEGTYPCSDVALRWESLFRSPILHPGSMYDRQQAVAVGGYRREFDVSEDYDLWTRLAQRGKLANLPEKLMKYRVHSRSVSTIHKERQVQQAARLAGAFAESQELEISSGEAASIYLFLATGEPPTDCSLDTVIRAFHVAARGFRDRAGTDAAELEAGIRDKQQSLRWRCLHQAEQNWRKPWKAWTWLRAAGRFDPEQGSLRKMVRRKLSPLFAMGK